MKSKSSSEIFSSLNTFKTTESPKSPKDFLERIKNLKDEDEDEPSDKIEILLEEIQNNKTEIDNEVLTKIIENVKENKIPLKFYDEFLFNLLLNNDLDDLVYEVSKRFDLQNNNIGKEIIKSMLDYDQTTLFNNLDYFGLNPNQLLEIVKKYGYKKHLFNPNFLERLEKLDQETMEIFIKNKRYDLVFKFADKFNLKHNRELAELTIEYGQPNQIKNVISNPEQYNLEYNQRLSELIIKYGELDQIENVFLNPKQYNLEFDEKSVELIIKYGSARLIRNIFIEPQEYNLTVSQLLDLKEKFDKDFNTEEPSYIVEESQRMINYLTRFYDHKEELPEYFIDDLLGEIDLDPDSKVTMDIDWQKVVNFIFKHLDDRLDTKNYDDLFIRLVKINPGVTYIIKECDWMKKCKKIPFTFFLKEYAWYIQPFNQLLHTNPKAIDLSKMEEIEINFDTDEKFAAEEMRKIYEIFKEKVSLTEKQEKWFKEAISFFKNLNGEEKLNDEEDLNYEAPF